MKKWLVASCREAQAVYKSEEGGERGRERGGGGERERKRERDNHSADGLHNVK